MSNELLTLRGLKQYFPVGKDRFVRAVDGVDLTINKGDVMGLVGESGSGKSTIAYTVMGMYGMTDGEIQFEDEVFTKATKRKRSMKFRREAQIVFQDPGSSLNPYQDVRSILSLPLKVHNVVPKDQIDDKILEILDMVELPPEFMYKSPNSIGGGEKQLVSIARALCCNPKFIILDEPTSSLDVSIQAKIINMLIKLHREQGLTYMFITHDMGVMRNVSNRVAIMYLGKICEIAPTEVFYSKPLHPYTQHPCGVRRGRGAEAQGSGVRGRDPVPGQRAQRMQLQHPVPLQVRALHEGGSRHAGDRAGTHDPLPPVRQIRACLCVHGHPEQQDGVEIKTHKHKEEHYEKDPCNDPGAGAQPQPAGWLRQHQIRRCSRGRPERFPSQHRAFFRRQHPQDRPCGHQRSGGQHLRREPV